MADRRRGTTGVFVLFLAIGLLQGGLAVALTRLGSDRWARPDSLPYLLACFSAGSAAGVLVCWLPRRLLPHRILLGGAVVATATGALSIVAAPFALVPAATFVAGAGFGALAVLLNAAAATGGDAVRRTNFGNGLFGIGAVSGPYIASQTSGGSWWALPAVVALVLVLGWPAATRAPVASVAPATDMGTVNRFVLGILLFAAFCYGGVENVAGGLLPQHLGSLEISSVGLYMSCFWGAMAIGRLIAAAVGHRVPPTRLITMAAAGAGGGCLLLAHPATALAGCAVVGLFAGPLLPTLLATLATLGAAPLGTTRLVLLCSLSGAAVFPILADLFRRTVPTHAGVPLAVGILLSLLLLSVLTANGARTAHSVATQRTPSRHASPDREKDVFPR
ncbi:hypothetical protein SAMN05216266_102206 [Amycolatopsis marina]|uniref:Fucose permease n=1 Tax=Amycolatopsis marina TaxID=490629 RepID=A0A1I0WTS5_9PSEU|nr:hypothetical protein [Amycolatopsis marina]SFA92135.1 hypothetical protein SAMN05216266_102206 [Amycolatopsis marina]